MEHLLIIPRKLIQGNLQRIKIYYSNRNPATDSNQNVQLTQDAFQLITSILEAFYCHHFNRYGAHLEASDLYWLTDAYVREALYSTRHLNPLNTEAYEEYVMAIANELVQLIRHITPYFQPVFRQMDLQHTDISEIELREDNHNQTVVCFVLRTEPITYVDDQGRDTYEADLAQFPLTVPNHPY